MDKWLVNKAKMENYRILIKLIHKIQLTKSSKQNWQFSVNWQQNKTIQQLDVIINIIPFQQKTF